MIEWNAKWYRIDLGRNGYGNRHDYIDCPVDWLEIFSGYLDVLDCSAYPRKYPLSKTYYGQKYGVGNVGFPSKVVPISIDCVKQLAKYMRKQHPTASWRILSAGDNQTALFQSNKSLSPVALAFEAGVASS